MPLATRLSYRVHALTPQALRVDGGIREFELGIYGTSESLAEYMDEPESDDC